MSSRWTLPIGSPSPSDPLLTDFCWRCGQVFTGTSYARQLAVHEAHCVIPGAAPLTSLVGEIVGKPLSGVPHAREFRNLHEPICRGTDEAARILALKSSEQVLRMKPFGFTGLNVLRRTRGMH